MFGPEFMAKLHMNPQTRPLLSQPDFMAMLQDMGSNPSNMSKYLADPRLQQALSVGLGINMMSGDKFKQEKGMNGAGASAAADQDDDTDDEMPVRMLAFPAAVFDLPTQICLHLPCWYMQPPNLRCMLALLLLPGTPQLALLSVIAAGHGNKHLHVICTNL